jgi:hypothetical protein
MPNRSGRVGTVSGTCPLDEGDVGARDEARLHP